MTNTVHLRPVDHEDLWKHLLQSAQEQVAFAFAQAVATDAGVAFQIEELYLVPPEELVVQADYHVALTDEAQAKVIKQAWDLRLALGEFHSHTSPLWPAKFSPSDLYGFEEFVPHVRWRLRGQPYFAIVAAPGGFDSLVWQTPTPEKLDELHVGLEISTPTGLTYEALARKKQS